MDAGKMLTFENTTEESISNKVDSISSELLILFHAINLAIVAAAVALFGIISNVFNIVIFIRLGLNDTANIGLFALAVSDLCSLVTLEWLCVLRNPLFINNVPMLGDDVQHLTAAWPHACFARITSWITVYITLERCLCVIIPLKIKRFITPKVTICVVVCISVVMFLSLVPEYATCYMGWKFVPEQNRSMLGLLYLPGRYQVVALSFMFAAGTQIISFGAIIIFTAILVVRMTQNTKWRRSICKSSCGSSNEINTRDNRAAKMITLVAIIYCACFFPMLCAFVTASIEPQFIIFGRYHNTFFVLWSFGFVFDCVNSSVNIFVYYRMSTKYRTMFQLLVGRKH